MWSLSGEDPPDRHALRDLVERGPERSGPRPRDVSSRLKLCAGWITPEALDPISAFDPADYPYRFNTFDHLVIHVFGLTFQAEHHAALDPALRVR